MAEEAKLERTAHGLVPTGEGWYVLDELGFPAVSRTERAGCGSPCLGLREPGEPGVSMSSAAGFLFRIVYSPTMAVGRVVAWLAAGYRQGTALERLLILPSWLVLRIAFLVGFALLLTLHVAARSPQNG